MFELPEINEVSLFSEFKQADFFIKSTNIDTLKSIQNHLSNWYKVTMSYKISLEKIKKGIEKYVPSNNRSQWCETDSNTLVLDAYNANPSSMRAALESFLETEKKGRLLILGDMLELGNFSEQEHQEIVDFIESKEIDQILLVGPEFKKTKSTALNIKKFLSPNEVIPYLQKTNFQNKFNPLLC